MGTFQLSFARPLDLRLFSDRVALASLFVFGAVGFWWGGLAEAVESGLAAYLSWALSREIDPDYPSSANLAALAGGAIALWLDTHAGVLFVMLLAIRVMVGSSGLSAARWEAGLMGLGAIVFSGTQTGWWAGMVMAAALFLDTRTSPAASPSHRWISGGAAFGASAFYLFLGDAGVWWWAHLAGVAAASLILVYGRIDPRRSLIIALPMAGFPTVAALLGKLAGGGLEDGPLGIYVLLGAGLLFSLALGAFRAEVASPTDRGGHKISAERVEMARILLAAFLLVSWASASTASVTGAAEPAAPLLAVVILVAFREMWRRAGWKIPGRPS